MEASEIRQRTINLGKQLVEALERDHVSNPITHWITHYVAQQIVEAETSASERREEAQKKCFESILMLWKHRASLPHGMRPLREFERLFETLDRLNPENPRFWHSHFHVDHDKTDEESKKILAIIEDLDRTARILMSELLSFAVESCHNEETALYLNNALGEAEGDDVRLAARLLQENNLQSEDAKRKQLTERLETLDRFVLAAVKIGNLMRSRLN